MGPRCGFWKGKHHSGPTQAIDFKSELPSIHCLYLLLFPTLIFHSPAPPLYSFFLSVLSLVLGRCKAQAFKKTAVRVPVWIKHTLNPRRPSFIVLWLRPQEESPRCRRFLPAEPRTLPQAEPRTPHTPAGRKAFPLALTFGTALHQPWHQPSEWVCP